MDTNHEGGTMGELLGYARTSTKEQRLDLQLDALRAAGVKDRYLYQDQASGARKDRPGFLQCLHDLREGDALVVWKLDRLARSLRHCIEVLDELKARQVRLVVLEGPFAHTSPETSEGKLLFGIFAAFAEFERDLIRDRVLAGLTAARSRGRRGGRRPKLSPTQQREAQVLARGGMPVAEIARHFGCARQTIYTVLGVAQPAQAEAAD
jgi:DNA invertase Pin-like site-specific DNA recombinase